MRKLRIRKKKTRIVSEIKQKAFATRKLHSIGIKKVRGRDVNYVGIGEISNIYKKHFKNELESDYLKWFYDKKFCEKDDTIYFIGNLEYGFVKIGYSKNPAKRLVGIQTGCPFPLSILHTEQGNQQHEQMYHEKFRYLNTYGEWFKIIGPIAEKLGIKKEKKVLSLYKDQENLDNEFKRMFSKWG